jgi:hypothetical protein
MVTFPFLFFFFLVRSFQNYLLTKRSQSPGVLGNKNDLCSKTKIIENKKPPAGPQDTICKSCLSAPLEIFQFLQDMRSGVM